MRGLYNANGQARQLPDFSLLLRYVSGMSPLQMKTRLEEFFPSCYVEVRDLTGTEDHYEVYVRSAVFAEMSRIEQHQKVMAAFTAELKTGEVHALSIRTAKEQA